MKGGVRRPRRGHDPPKRQTQLIGNTVNPRCYSFMFRPGEGYQRSPSRTVIRSAKPNPDVGTPVCGVIDHCTAPTFLIPLSGKVIPRRGEETLEPPEAVNRDIRTFISVLPVRVLPSLVSTVSNTTHQPENSSISHASSVHLKPSWASQYTP